MKFLKLITSGAARATSALLLSASFKALKKKFEAKSQQSESEDENSSKTAKQIPEEPSLTKVGTTILEYLASKEKDFDAFTDELAVKYQDGLIKVSKYFTEKAIAGAKEIKSISWEDDRLLVTVVVGNGKKTKAKSSSEEILQAIKDNFESGENPINVRFDFTNEK